MIKCAFALQPFVDLRDGGRPWTENIRNVPMKDVFRAPKAKLRKPVRRAKFKCMDTALAEVCLFCGGNGMGAGFSLARRAEWVPPDPRPGNSHPPLEHPALRMGPPPPDAQGARGQDWRRAWP